MKVVSLVPSWTETLVEAGVDVVGRTRFCLHPHEKVKAIPVVGGTKDWNLEKIKALNPDLLILDREENPKFMGEAGIPFLATHVTCVEDMPKALGELSSTLGIPKLNALSLEWTAMIKRSARPRWDQSQELPSLIEWGIKPTQKIEKIIYVIWKDPWMVVSKDTFIGSMLKYLGMENLIQTYSEKYPKLDLQSEPAKESTLLLFSSEPYPFLKKREGLSELGFPYAFVNGENLSWFGIRSLRFLQGSR